MIDRMLDRMKFNAVRAEVYGDLADTLDSTGVRRCLQSLALDKDKRMAAIFARMTASFERGQSLSRALSEVAPLADVQMLRAFEVRAKSDADLCQGLRILADTAEGTKKVSDSFMSLGIQVVINGLLLVAMLVLMRTTGFDLFAQLLPVAKWSGYSQSVYTLSGFTQNYWHLIGASWLALMGWFFWSLPRWDGPLRARLDKYAPYAWYRRKASTETLTTLAAQMQANQPVGTALEDMMQTSSPWQRYYLSQMWRNLTRVQGARIFDVGYFDERAMSRMYLLAEGGRLQDVLLNLGLKNQAKTVEKMVKRLTLATNAVKQTSKGIGVALLAAVFLLGPQIADSLMGGLSVAR